MKLPLKLEYACRVLIQLKPTFLSGKVRRIDDLAERECISPNYLVQILNDLRTAGLVESKRGKNGGYCLVRDPSEITMEDVVGATEGAFLQLNGASEGESGGAAAEAWKRVFESVNEELRQHRLSDLGEVEVVDSWEI